MQHLQIIDSHQHFWQIGRFHYDWMSSDDKILYKDFLPDNFETIRRENQIAQIVAVQAHQSIEETDWLLALSDRFDFIGGIVGWVDLRHENLEKQLGKLALKPKFKGVRHLVQDEAEDEWLIKPDVVKGIKKLAEYDLTYDILVFPRHLKYVKTLLEKCPENKFVIDHLAKPPIAEGKIDEWAGDIKSIAESPNVFCKLSGLVTEADHRNWTIDDLRPYAEVALKAFGADRLMFGSDYPVCLLAADYEKVLKTYLSFFDYLDEAEQNKIFNENAARFYDL